MPEDRHAWATETIWKMWPTVGEYADHPLGEWFHEHVTQRPWERRYRPRRTIGLVLFFAFFILLIFALPFFFCPAIMLIIPAYLVLKVIFVPKRPRKILAQPAAVFDSRRAHFLQELWLTGISYQELAAIEISLAISRPLRREMWWFGLSLWIIAACAVLLPILIEAGGNVEIIVLIGSAALFWFQSYLFHFNTNKQAIRALKGMVLDIEQRARGKTPELGRQVRNSVIACFCVAAFMIFAGFLFGEEHVATFFFAGLFIFGSVYMFFAERDLQPRAVQELFVETSARGRDYFAQIIHSESERDMPRK